MNNQKFTVILDPGHGSDTPGKRSPLRKDGTRLYEWKFNRQLTDRIMDLLDVNGIRVVNVVTEDKDISLTERYKRVQSYVLGHPDEKCIFLSIHGNAAGSKGEWMTGKGWEVYTTRGQNESDKLAECLYDAAKVAFKDKKLRMDKTDGDSDKEANFTVIYGVDHANKKECRIPAVLIEHFFYDNEEECEFMLSDEGQERMAMVDVEGCMRYFMLNNKQ